MKERMSIRLTYAQLRLLEQIGSDLGIPRSAVATALIRWSLRLMSTTSDFVERESTAMDAHIRGHFPMNWAEDLAQAQVDSLLVDMIREGKNPRDVQ